MNPTIMLLTASGNPAVLRCLEQGHGSRGSIWACILDSHARANVGAARRCSKSTPTKGRATRPPLPSIAGERAGHSWSRVPRHCGQSQIVRRTRMLACWVHLVRGCVLAPRSRCCDSVRACVCTCSAPDQVVTVQDTCCLSGTSARREGTSRRSRSCRAHRAGSRGVRAEFGLKR